MDSLAEIRNMVSACIQCGTCTGSCPNAFAMDLTPRQLWYNVLMGEKETIFHSKTFSLCSVCYYCTLRCPRGLPLTETMSALKQIAAKENLAPYKKSIRFYKSFMESVRRHGRVREMEFMTLYFLSMKNPLMPLQFAPLGMKLMSKGKVSFEIPSKGSNALESIFLKVEELEQR
ncbi:MAG: heterodisulfide reductase [Desulfobacteraceae bacterium]|nr:MAG: heterodisulfide reductase [Desulfobacteraceae bacterium]